MKEALYIQVKGIVQGVGFRPFVYRLAKKYLISGWVLNATDGVFIHAEAEAKLLDEFVIELSENPPAASKVEEIEMKEVPLEDFESFEIRFSDSTEVDKTTLVSPDLATCEDCERELFDPSDRRFRYPFINCTNCGPRFTIIEDLPYDRKNTSMMDFPLCEQCAEEYGDPLDRRFHAQPDACFDCGPHLFWREHQQGIGSPFADPLWGSSPEKSNLIFRRAVDFLLQGKILAVKGLGGFHLVCDANNPSALAVLRERKRRKGKAFAVMAESLDSIEGLCEVSQGEVRALTSSHRPIVLLRKRPEASFSEGLADGLTELGVMLPYTPIQHMLIRDFKEAGGGGLLVMTSANLHNEPIVVDDGEAAEKLVSIADALIGHNRAIRTRYDDSVVRIISTGNNEEAVQYIRRARGYAPLPLPLPVQALEQANGRNADDRWSVLAVGPEQKNTFTFTRGSEAFVSQHIGDLENAETYDAWLSAQSCYEKLFRLSPDQIACDRHPEYLSTKWAKDQRNAKAAPVFEVQHHHAHLASVMGEHGLFGPVCGVAFDGTGLGVDGSLWGGEVLLANLETFERFANLACVPMPGGAAAIKNPLRMAYGVLWAFDLLDHPAAQRVVEGLGAQAALCEQMIDQGINTPMTSSVGRLFDAASALLGVCEEPHYEGEPAILLEAAMGGDSDGDRDASCAERYALAVVKNTALETSTAQDTSVVLLDAAQTFEALLDDLAAGVPVSVIARRFHDAFVTAVVVVAEIVRSFYSIETVVLSGGVFMNRYLIENAISELKEAGFTVAINSDLPPNDGCISYGQAVVTWASRNRCE